MCWEVQYQPGSGRLGGAIAMTGSCLSIGSMMAFPSPSRQPSTWWHFWNTQTSYSRQQLYKWFVELGNWESKNGFLWAVTVSSVGIWQRCRRYDCSSMSQEIHSCIFRWRKFYYSFKIMNCWQSKPPWLSRLLGRMEYCYFMTKRTVKAMPSSVKPMFACYGIHTRRWIQSHTLLHFSLSIWSMIDMVQFTCITIEVIERGLRVGLRGEGDASTTWLCAPASAWRHSPEKDPQWVHQIRVIRR